MADLESLRRQYGGDDVQFVYHGDGLIKISVANRAASADIFLHGATVTHWQPAGQSHPVLFTSAQSHFKPDKAIRGGVPICWPWFGPHPTEARRPQHGVVRARPWKLARVMTLDRDRTRLTFEIDADDGSDLSAEYVVEVGPTLQLSLKSRNRGEKPARLEMALHTYLTVGDSRAARITGLEGVEYIDKVAAGRRTKQGDEPIAFTGETDRVYVNTESTCVLEDPALGRTIAVSKTGSKSTVVWNPWADKARSLPDFGDDEWQRMCCIESANAADNAIDLARNGEQEMTVELAVT